jgi:alanine racemase
LLVEGIFTHFAMADDKNKDYTKNQFDLFTYFCEKLEQSGINTGLKHCCNSAAILNFKEMHLDMVRPGIILYGLPPDNDLDSVREYDLRPAMELKSVISYVKEVRDGVSVSYGGTFTTKQSAKIATLPIGYADGFSRILSNNTEILINKKRARIIVGYVMDQCMADVTDINNVSTSNVATIFGQDGDEFISACKIASDLGTIRV